MIKSKKAQGISLTVIVVAAIALLVMVVLILVFTGKIGNFTSNVDVCENKGGVCQDTCNRANLETELSGATCKDSSGQPDNTQKCCLKVAPTN
jgi:hypothetical protein